MNRFLFSSNCLLSSGFSFFLLPFFSFFLSLWVGVFLVLDPPMKMVVVMV